MCIGTCALAHVHLPIMGILTSGERLSTGVTAAGYLFVNAHANVHMHICGYQYAYCIYAYGWITYHPQKEELCCWWLFWPVSWISKTIQIKFWKKSLFYCFIFDHTRHIHSPYNRYKLFCDKDYIYSKFKVQDNL